MRLGRYSELVKELVRVNGEGRQAGGGGQGGRGGRVGEERLWVWVGPDELETILYSFYPVSHSLLPLPS